MSLNFLVKPGHWIIFLFLVGFGSGMFGAGIILTFEHLIYPIASNPQNVIAYNDAILHKHNQTYTFVFQFNTTDSFVERNPISVKVDAILPGVISDCVKVRFAGSAGNYSAIFHEATISIPISNNLSVFCHSNSQNELVLFKQVDTYESNQTLTLKYGMTGDWGIWYFNPYDYQIYGDYVPNVIHISPSDSLIQLQTNRFQNYFNTEVLSLTFVIAGGTMLLLATQLYPKKKRD